MEILGRKTKILLITLLVAILTATAVTFGITNGVAASAGSINMAQYANAEVGDIVTFGNYYQDADGLTKTPIEWLVVDKDARTGQLTLFSKHVLAGGSFWGNYYHDIDNGWIKNSPGVGEAPAGVSFNQNWADSTLRAWLNNLERTDVHGDKFTKEGIQLYADKVTPTKAIGIASSNQAIFTYQHSDLKHNVGYSNSNQWTGLTSVDGSDLAANSGLFKRQDNNEVYYKRPHNSARPAVNGFLDEAFTQEEQGYIVPKVISGQICHEWPNNSYYTEDKIVTPTTVDKIWVPSTAELNIEDGKDWNNLPDDGKGNNNWSSATDNSTSDAFAFFKQFQNADELTAAIRATGTAFDRNPQVSNFSIPLDVDKNSIGTGNTQIDTRYSDYWGNSGTRYYWTRTPASAWYSGICYIVASGSFVYNNTDDSYVGARPALILKYK